MRLRHARISIELHELSRGQGIPLLLLHELFGSAAEWPDDVMTWKGPIYALDFCGHGKSEPLVGGAYVPEVLVADADTALREIGSAAVAGAGLGAYVALILAGSRASQVPAALLFGGRGLDGGGPEPHWGSKLDVHYSAPAADEPSDGVHDPLVRALARDPRPPEYAATFGAAARHLLFADDVVGAPPWWHAARGACPNAATTPSAPAVALDRLRAAIS